jgi:hypothetical protein
MTNPNQLSGSERTGAGPGAGTPRTDPTGQRVQRASRMTEPERQLTTTDETESLAEWIAQLPRHPFKP